jgi:hypothetical protein
MNARFDDDDGESFEPRDLADFEAELRRVLEQRLVQAAQSPRQPTADEAAQLARMVAHMDGPNHAQRPLAHGPVLHAREAAPAPSGRADGHGARGRGAPPIGTASAGVPPSSGPTSRAPITAARQQTSQRRALLRMYGPLAAVVLGVALVRWVVPGPSVAVPPTVDLAARVSSTGEVRPTDGVYLGADQGSGAASIEFTGSVTWDPRGQDGVVRVAVFDRDGDPGRALTEELVEGAVWTPTGRLPKRFRVVVDRPADDGVGREELHCADYFVP